MYPHGSQLALLRFGGSEFRTDLRCVGRTSWESNYDDTMMTSQPHSLGMDCFALDKRATRVAVALEPRVCPCPIVHTSRV